ncbi:hypothetical protein BOFL111202_17140 [Bordetella flabilis]
MCIYPFAAQRADHLQGHVAKAVVRYTPWWGIPSAVRVRFNPWLCVFHDEPGGPKPFVAFGGREGMEAAVEHVIGPAISSRQEAPR